MSARSLATVPAVPLVSAPAGPRVARAQREVEQPGKRLFDVVVAVLLLVVFLPVLVACAVAVKLADGGPVVYRQRRVGRGGRTFVILKLRTMIEGADRLVPTLRGHNARDGLLFKVADDPRVTRVGRVLRRFALDELPQLWNVVRGDMSIVGPRPLPVDPDAFGAADGARHHVRPGITGRWQVEGGNTYREMLEHDLAYIRDWSLTTDVRLLAATFPAVLGRRAVC